MRLAGQDDVARLKCQKLGDVRDQSIHRAHQIGKAGTAAEFPIDRNSNLPRLAIGYLQRRLRKTHRGNAAESQADNTIRAGC